MWELLNQWNRKGRKSICCIVNKKAKKEMEISLGVNDFTRYPSMCSERKHMKEMFFAEKNEEIWYFFFYIRLRKQDDLYTREAEIKESRRRFFFMLLDALIKFQRWWGRKSLFSWIKIEFFFIAQSFGNSRSPAKIPFSWIKCEIKSRP